MQNIQQSQDEQINGAASKENAYSQVRRTIRKINQGNSAYPGDQFGHGGDCSKKQQPYPDPSHTRLLANGIPIPNCLCSREQDDDKT